MKSTIRHSQSARRGEARRSRAIAFTLVELLVVVSIIVVLIAMLVPAVEEAFETALRAKCASNLHAVHSGTMDYGLANRGELYTTRGRQVPGSFDELGYGHAGHQRADDRKVDWPRTLSTVGLATPNKVPVQIWDGAGTNPTRMLHKPYQFWMCPTLKLFSEPVTSNKHHSLAVGYMYMGGIEVWRNPEYPDTKGIESASPVRLGEGGSSWALAADYLMKQNGKWIDQHTMVRGVPQGGNHVYMDGSAQWVTFDRLLYLHSWNPGPSRVVLWHQQDTGSYKPGAIAESSNWD